jgi:AcrR family transcriptional regulator
MPRLTGDQTVRSLLDASRIVLASKGAAALTLDAVVKHTGVTKGALLHHFRSKQALVLRVLRDSVKEFDALVEQVRGADRTPGSYARAYVQATTTLATKPDIQRTLQTLAELSRDPQLAHQFGAASRNWTRQFERDGLDPVLAQVIRLAADGFWLNETTRAGSLSRNRRSQVATRLIKMSHY